MSEKPNPPPKGDEKPEKAEKSTPTPEWQKAGYDGPLTSEQAAWRNTHLDRLGDKKTKPAAAGATK